MVASRQVEIPFYRLVGKQTGRGFGALAQVFGRNATPFLHKYVVSVAKRIGADVLDFAAPEIGGSLPVENLSKRLQRVWEDKL